MPEQKRRFEHLTEEEQQVASEFVRRVRQKLDGRLVSAVLFGSRARGEASAHSDMDVLVVVTDPGLEERKMIHHMAVEICIEFGIYPSTRVWSCQHWRLVQKQRTMLYWNISRDGINLFPSAP
jgi:predicted nucleotidyltransferase